MNTSVGSSPKLQPGGLLAFEFGRPSLILLVLTTVLIIATGLFQWERYTGLRKAQIDQIKETTNKVAAQISDDIWELQNLIWSLMSLQHDSLTQLTARPDDVKRYRNIENDLRRKLRDMLWFTVFDESGHLLIDDFDGFVGTTSPAYVHRFAENSRGGHIALHPNSQGSYFGVTIPWRGSVSLFVAFSPDYVSRTLAREQTAGHSLLLLRQDSDTIEITSQGARADLQRAPQMSPEELNRIAASASVSGTLWQLVALPEASLLQAELNRLIWEFILIIVGLLMIVVLALWLINRENLRRQYALRSLRQSEERFSQLAEHLHQVFWMYDAENLLYVSPAFEQVWNRSRQDLLERRTNWLDTIHPDDRKRLAKLHGPEPATAEFDEEYRIILPDGSQRWIWDRGFPIRNEASGRIYRIAGIAEDITERKQALEALRKAHDELEERVKERTVELEKEIAERKLAEERMRSYAVQVERSNRELKDFAYVCSHDLQEPLRKIQAFSDRLQTKYRDSIPERGQDYLERMQNAASRMQKLIGDLLTLSRVENRALTTESLSLAEIARQTLSDLEVKLEETKGKVIIEDLPHIDADPGQMRQLLQNLLGNALKFHRPNTPPEIRIYGELVDNGERLQFYVQDNGIGFDEKYLGKIFTAFQRLHGRDVYEGTGIGLSICHRIVGRHGGSITAKSKPGEGTTFVVTLPVKHSRQQALSKTEESGA